MKIFFLFLLMLGACSPKTPTEPVFIVRDFTAENIFSNNIEGPAFDRAGNLFVVNFARNGTVGKVLPNGQAELFVELPSGSTANSIQFNSRGEMLLADFTGHNILKVDMLTRKVSTWVHDVRFNQPNDICVSETDQVFASDPNWKEQTGKLWRIDADGSVHLIEENMGTTNGICLSPDERILYVNESVQRKVWRYSLDDNNKVLSKAIFTSFTDYGMDGMKCDSKGNLYITRYGKGTIAVLSPSGDLIREVPLKGKNCSNLVFGGKDKRTVYVTLQDRKGMEYFLNDIPGK